MDVEHMFVRLISTTVGIALEEREPRLLVNMLGLQALARTENVLHHAWVLRRTLVVILQRILRTAFRDMTRPSAMTLPHLPNLSVKALDQIARSA